MRKWRLWIGGKDASILLARALLSRSISSHQQELRAPSFAYRCLFPSLCLYAPTPVAMGSAPSKTERSASKRYPVLATSAAPVRAA